MKRLLSAFLTLLLLAALPVTALAAGSITVSTSMSTAAVGSEITVSGTAPADTWITLEGTDADGNILYFSAVLSDAAGSYSKTVKVPYMNNGTLTFTVGNGSVTTSSGLTVYTPASSDDSGSSVVSKISVTFDSVAQAALNEKTNGSYTVKADEVSVSSLSDAAKALIGSRPVYDINVTSGGKTISSFGGGTATVYVPYNLSPGENANKIIIYYISDSGSLVAVPNCKYDPETGKVIFTTKHLSIYAVGYNSVSFSDVADSAWYVDYVDFLSARSIVGGNNGAFSPDTSITRAEFVTILARMSGDDLSGYTTSSFTDVASTDWYFVAVQWAYTKAVSTGADGKFDPTANITREQVATMLYRYAEYMGNLSNAEGMSAREFSDYDSISSWAQAPVQWAMNNGIITGNPDGSFAPKANATRAQAAKMVAVLLQSMIET